MWRACRATVGATTACVHHGIDLMPLLTSLPFGPSLDGATAQTVSTTASCVAGGMVINTLSLPLRLYLLSLYGQPLFRAMEQGERRWRSPPPPPSY